MSDGGMMLFSGNSNLHWSKGVAGWLNLRQEELLSGGSVTAR